MSDAQAVSPVILFVDDEATAVKYFQRAIDSLAPVITAGSVEAGKALLDAHAGTLAVLVSDQRMPGEYGNELLRYAKDRYPHMVRILTTAYSELEHTVEAINQGQIHRYIKKPWDIAGLRMEMKQAVEFANLRKERDYLLREKLMVRQRQMIGNRIGLLSALCTSLSSPDFLPVETYLAAALAAGVTPPEPDWLLMDYSDLISAEAARSGEFGLVVASKLKDIRQRYEGYQGKDAIDVLFEVLAGRVQLSSDGTLVFLDELDLTEFLETQAQVAVSPQHASWLAFLIWLGGLGWSLKIVKSGVGLQASLVKPEAPVSATRLVAWIEQF